jgi:hypothetical protein
MAFEKLVSFTKDVSDLADKPALGSAAALKAHFDAAPDEVRQYFNKLIDSLQKTTEGDSGAKNVGATSISGLTGTDVQTLLESLYNLAKKTPPTWSNLSTLNGWVTADLSLYQPKVLKDDWGMVTFDGGRIKNGTTTGGTAIFNIPVGMRPSKHVIWKEGTTTFVLDSATGNIVGFGLDASDTIVGQSTWKAEQ